MSDISVPTYQEILENITDGILVLNADEDIIHVNQALCRILGYAREELIGQSIFKLYPPEDHKAARQRLTERQQGKTTSYKGHYQTRDGRFLYISVYSVPVFDDTGQFNGCYTVVRNITEQKALEKAVIAEKDFFDDLVELCPDGIVGVNRQGIIIIFNEAAERMTRYNAQEVIGKMYITEIYAVSGIARTIKKRLYSTDYGGKGRIDGMEAEIQDKANHRIPIRLSATLIRQNGEEIGSVGFFHDMTRQKRIEAKLQELSITDSLSGLFNQRHFHMAFESAISNAERYKRPLSIIFLDIDNFKQINDRLGHLEGDAVIRLAGQIFREHTRKGDLAFRYGGDEFMVILPETKVADAFICAEKIRKEFNANWSMSDACEGFDIPCATLSLGVAAFNFGEPRELFIRRADLAMYEAKKAGGNQTVEAVAQIGRGE